MTDSGGAPTSADVALEVIVDPQLRAALDEIVHTEHRDLNEVVLEAVVSYLRPF